MPSLKLPIVVQAEKQQERLELEAPVIAMLKNALHVKRISVLTEAIEAAEELDQRLFKMVLSTL